MAMKRALAAIGILVALFLAVKFYFHATAGPASTVDTRGLATPGHPVVSPSGQFLLAAREETAGGVKQWRFVISRTDADRGELFTSADAYRTRDALFFMWDADDRVWVYSGDVGTFFWVRQTDVDWQKHPYVEQSDIPAPPLLKELRPTQFGGVRGGKRDVLVRLRLPG